MLPLFNERLRLILLYNLTFNVISNIRKEIIMLHNWITITPKKSKYEILYSIRLISLVSFAFDTVIIQGPRDERRGIRDFIY